MKDIIIFELVSEREREGRRIRTPKSETKLTSLFGFNRWPESKTC